MRLFASAASRLVQSRIAANAFISVTLFAGALALVACGDRTVQESHGTAATQNLPKREIATPLAPSAATEHTRKQHREQNSYLTAVEDINDAALAQQGLIATADQRRIPGPNGWVSWDAESYDFMTGEAPTTVNPSLWRQAKLNNVMGLFEVTQGVYQLRGFDLANMTLIEGDSGWIVVDPLTNAETSRAALAFAHEHLPKRPVSAVLFTHSHIDHFGGVGGVVTQAELDAGTVAIIAPEGFLQEATSEMVLAGQVMSRRADFMYGRRLPRNAQGHIGSGLGKQPALGSISIASPTRVISSPYESMVIDGVPFNFQLVSGSEAPAEFTFYLPEQRAFCGAELVSRNLHNLYTLRGAKVRDALAWSGFIDDAIHAFPDMQVIFNSHHWPVWGASAAREFLEDQRDVYKYIHDQTLHLASQGMTPNEIAETIALPPALQSALHVHDYYGTLKHNAKAVYQFYFGFYDGHPSNLDPLPPVESAQRYVALMGGSDAVVTAATQAFDRGEYRWVAELLKHVVFTQPDHEGARQLLAAAFDQLGYQAESGPWRDVYLSGAYELRHGAPKTPLPTGMIDGLLRATPVERFFELVATMVDGPKAAELSLTLNFELLDRQQNFILSLERGVLHHREATPDPDAHVSIRVSHELLIRLLLKRVPISELLTTDALEISGNPLRLIQFVGVLEPGDPTFALVTP
jgi:alkyl sulfatase BDS1-like metallo-beta-lactamase superfamily hydrolase